MCVSSCGRPSGEPEETRGLALLADMTKPLRRRKEVRPRLRQVVLRIKKGKSGD